MINQKQKSVAKLFVKNPDQKQKNLHADNGDNSNLQKIMQLPITVAQCCGLFPVCGISSPTAQGLQFKWFTFRTVFSIFCITGNICMAVFFFYWISTRGLRLENMGSLVFYSTSLICTILFLRLAKKWPTLAQEWELVEGKFSQYPSVKNSPLIYKRILIITLSLAFSTFFDLVLLNFA